MVEIEKVYVFDGPNGDARLVDLFDGRSGVYGPPSSCFPVMGRKAAPAGRRHRYQLLLGFLGNTSYPRHQLRNGVPGAAGRLQRSGRPSEAGTSPGIPRTVPTSTATTSGSRSTRQRGPGAYNYRSKADYEALGVCSFGADQPFEMPGRQLLPAGRRPPGPPCAVPVRAGPGVDRRLLRVFPGSYRPRPPGGPAATRARSGSAVVLHLVPSAARRSRSLAHRRARDSGRLTQVARHLLRARDLADARYAEPLDGPTLPEPPGCPRPFQPRLSPDVRRVVLAHPLRQPGRRLAPGGVRNGIGSDRPAAPVQRDAASLRGRGARHPALPEPFLGRIQHEPHHRLPLGRQPYADPSPNKFDRGELLLVLTTLAPR